MASVGTSLNSPAAYFSVGRPLAATVQATTRTTVLYSDRRSLRVAYQLRDALGESRVSSSQLSVTMVLTFTDGQTYSATCGGRDASSGIGECSQTLPASMFSSTTRQATVTVSGQYGTQTPFGSSQAGAVSLQAVMAASTLQSAGMVARLPESPRFVGDRFDVSISAHTGASTFALVGWSVLLTFRTSVLQLATSSFNTLYNTPTYVIDSTGVNGTFNVVATGLSVGTHTNADVTGLTSLELMTLTFDVVGGTGAEADVLSGVVGAFVNQGTQRYLTDATLSVTDYRGGLQTSGMLDVEPVQVVGVMAYVQSASFVNTASLDGTSVSSGVTAVQLFNRAASSSSVTSQYACSSADADVITVLQSSCTVSLTTAQTTGGVTQVSVLSADGTTLTQVPVAVWYPQSVTASVEDSQLNLLAAISTPSACAAGEAYQQTTVSAVAAFGGTGVLSSGQLDVSSLVSFSSSSTSVVTISGRSVLGVAPGSALVQAQASSATLATTAALVFVSSTTVTVSYMSAAAVTSIGWSTYPPSVYPWEPLDGMFAVRAQLVQSFSREGDSGTLMAIVAFSDGTERTLPASELSFNSTTSGLDVALQGGAWRATVAVGATLACGQYLTVDWRVCNQAVASGVGVVNLKMPSVVAITVVVQASRLAAPDDSATASPISIGSSATVSVQASFSDGSSKDFSSDSRTEVVVATASAACAQITSGNVVSILSGATCDRVYVVASLPSLAGAMDATTSVAVVQFSTLQLTVLPYPSYQGYSSQSVASFGRLGGSNYFQRGQLQVSALLSDGSLIAISSQSTVTSTTPLVLSVAGLGSTWELAPSTVGTAQVNVSFGAHSSLVSLPVLNESVAVTAVSLTLSNVNAGNDYTFAALFESPRSSSVSLSFADGTVVPDVSSLSWVPLSALVEFSSANPAAILADASGSYTLLGNDYALVALTASYTYDTSVNDVLRVAANLAADVGGVDLGQQLGLQFAQSGSFVDVPVYGNSLDGALINYQVEVYFDPSIFAATTCVTGALNGFTCTLNDPLERAKLIATDVSSTATGANVHLGTFTLRVRASGVTYINGTIVEFVRTAWGSGNELRSSLEPIVAGAGYADVHSSARRQLTSPAEGRSWLPDIHQMRRRRLAASCAMENGCMAGMYGDVNGDCMLTAYDALWASQVYIGTRSFDALCPWAQAQLDPTLDGQPAM
eukprot:2241082-Prymnesium_polylepis.1